MGEESTDVTDNEKAESQMEVNTESIDAKIEVERPLEDSVKYEEHYGVKENTEIKTERVSVPMTMSEIKVEPCDEPMELTMTGGVAPSNILLPVSIL